MALTSILAAVDLFPQDDVVPGRAIEIAATHHASLTVVHVIDFPETNLDMARHDTLRGQAELAAATGSRRRFPAMVQIQPRSRSASPALRLIGPPRLECFPTPILMASGFCRMIGTLYPIVL